MQREFLLYLAGPIRGLSYGEATDWREYVKSKLPPYILPLSPMRHKEFLKSEQDLGHSYQHPLATMQGVICRDRFDVMRSDALLVNLLGAKKVSIGTVIELGWADGFRKPVILAIEEKGNPHEHGMVKQIASFITDNLNEAIQLAIAVLSP